MAVMQLQITSRAASGQGDVTGPVALSTACVARMVLDDSQLPSKTEAYRLAKLVVRAIEQDTWAPASGVTPSTAGGLGYTIAVGAVDASAVQQITADAASGYPFAIGFEPNGGDAADSKLACVTFAGALAAKLTAINWPMT